MVPAKSSCSPLAPYPSVGATRTLRPSPSSRAAACPATACAIIASVARGRWGPCCSVDPTGTSTSGRSSSTRGHLWLPSDGAAGGVSAEPGTTA